jgi:glycosyltransferase involved in cell wall biosynthesis
MQMKATFLESIHSKLPVAVELPAPETQTEVPMRPAPAPVAQPVPQSIFKKLKCLIIVPAFNESRSVGKLVHRLNRALPDCHVLVIDDGSTDDTVRKIPACATVVSLPFNLGIGGAMQTGYRYADIHGYDIAVQVDGDGQHRPCEVDKLVRALIDRNADLVVGSRFFESTTFVPSLTRMTGIKVLGAWIQFLSGLKITDCTSGFRAVNHKVIRAYAHWYPEDYPEPEVALLLHRSKFKVIEIPVKMRRRMYGKSTISLAHGLFYVVKVGACLFLDMIRQPWPSGKIGSPPNRVVKEVGK